MGKRTQSGRPMVVGSHGRHRFQTGMVTAALVARGMAMEQAFLMSRQLRQDIEGQTEIRTGELRSRIEALLEAAGLPREEPGPVAAIPPPLVRDLTATGMDPARIAIALGPELADEDSIELEEPFARRLRLLRWIRESERPVVVFLAGATGTGKSSLALQLGVRLGIPVVVGTDMIREAMRAVLSPELVPGLHDHSFRGMILGGTALSDPRERVLVGFRQQAAQVSVGVAGVIRRALREGSHVIIEGTHLQPPFSRYVPAGSEAVVAGLMLAVPSKRVHRQRFPERAARNRLRDPDAYLDAFQSVRWIHDDLLAQAEDADVMVLPTRALDTTIGAAFDALASQLPPVFGAGVIIAPRRPPAFDRDDQRTLFLVLDGLADEPQEALGGLTPLEAAHTPIFDRLASSGGQGQIETTAVPGAIPHTDEGMWAILGTELPTEPVGRGLIEAAGRGLPLPSEAVLFRGNLATRALNSRSLLDRRAGRIASGVEDLVAELRDVTLPGGVRGRVFAAHEHRVVVMLVGPGLSAAVSDTDPGGHADPQRVLRPEPLDESPEAARTAAALRELLSRASRHLEQHPLNLAREDRGELSANTILTRGAAHVGDTPASQPLPVRGAMIAACPAALGVGHLMGMTCVTGPSMTGNLDTDIEAKLAAAEPLLADRALVAVHLKGTDIAAHDRRPLAKRDYIERVDAALGAFLEGWEAAEQPALRVVVTADHGTSSATGQHLIGPVPVLVAMVSDDGDSEGSFTEASAHEGALGLLRPGELAKMLWDGV